MKNWKYETQHDESLTTSKFLCILLLIILIYRYIKYLFLTKSLTLAFIRACLEDTALIIIVAFLIPIIIFFLDWALYTLLKNKAIKSGKTYSGTIKEEIKQRRARRSGVYTTYRYIVCLEDGTTVKSPVYIERIYEKKCVVHKYLWMIVLTDFDDV